MSSHSSNPVLSRRRILQGFAVIAATTMVSGCGGTLFRPLTSTSSNQPLPPTTPVAPPGPPTPPGPSPPSLTPQPLPIGAITAASLTVTNNPVGTVGPGFVGLSYQKQALTTSLFSGTNNNLIGLFKGLGSGVLRVSGSSVDQNVWTPSGNGQMPGQIAPSDVDALASFLKAAGWTCIYGVNLGGAATGATNPALAAAEVAYVSQQLGASLVGVELGHECETYGNPGSFYPYNWTVEKFESLWMQYRAAIVAVTPAAPFAGPAAGSNVDSWTIPFGEYVTDGQIDLLTQHYYRGDASAASIDDLVSPDPALLSCLLQMKYGAQSIDVPFRIDECNSYSGGGAAGVSNAYASSLWAIDMIFNCALGGGAGVNFAGNSQDANTPIADNQGSVLGATPLYYGLRMAAMAGEGTLLGTKLSAGSLNATSYALQNASGGLSLLVVNKDATQNLDLSITLPASSSSATLLAMTQASAGTTLPNLAALSGVTIQGAAVAVDGAFALGTGYDLAITGQQLSCYVPFSSAVLIQLT
jgi:hypothetical protein